MDLELTGKRCVVTGASKGIGRGIAIALASEGAAVVLVARRSQLLEQLSAELLVKTGRKPAIVVADIMAPQSAAQVRDEAIAALSGVDILINAAGGSRPLELFAEEERWEEAMTLNFTRLRQLTHAMLPAMMANGWGRIVNITGKSEPKGINAANAAKAAVHMWAKGLSREIGPYGITINSIAPSTVESEQSDRNHPQELRSELVKSIPVRRLGRPEDLAALAAFLCSPCAGYLTGTIIAADGGSRRHAF